MSCTRCGSPVVFSEGMCRLCARQVSRERVALDQLSLKDDVKEETVLERAKVFSSSKHREVDRSLAVLTAIDLAKLGRRLHELVSVDVANPSSPDGYARATPGASVETAPAQIVRACVGDDGALRHEFGGSCDFCSRVTLTPVEGAVSALQGRQVDEYHRKVEAALGYLEDAANALRAAVAKISDVDKLRDAAGLADGEPGCWALERVGAWEPVLHRAVVEGVERPLGTWAYGFYRRNGRVPNRRECTDHVAGARRVKPSPVTA